MRENGYKETCMEQEILNVLITIIKVNGNMVRNMAKDF